MRTRIEQVFDCFLKNNIVAPMSVLVGFSGGADSLALLYLLMEFRCKYQLIIHLAHIDHGWREESRREAEELRSLSSELSLPFYCKVLDPHSMEGNIEDACRYERLDFFSELCREHSLRAVFLGHHADDQAETVLKRILEGASLSNLSGIRDVCDYQGTMLWRPLLPVTKKEIVTWLKARQLVYLEDKTNADQRFTRARMRHTIIPELSKQFGKNVSRNLCRLALEAQDLRRDLDREIEPLISVAKKGPFGLWLDFSTNMPDSGMVLRYLLKHICEGEIVTRDMLNRMCDLLKNGKANSIVVVGSRKIYIDRKHLFVVEKEVPSCYGNGYLHEGTQRVGQWDVTIEDAGDDVEYESSSWRELWCGEIRAVIPKDDYYMAFPDLSEAYHKNSSLKKWWMNHKVPTFIRRCIPVLYDAERKIQHEFLTGKIIKKKGVERIVLKALYSIS